MTIEFDCEHCGHHFEVDESLAGKHGHCKNCGQEMIVPATEFRLSPLADDELRAHAPAAPAKPESFAVEPRKESVKLEPIHDQASPPGIPEEYVADRAPYEIDPDFEPPASAVSPPTSRAMMEARAGWRHTVLTLQGKLSKFEDLIYLALMVFWLIGAIAFLFELKPLAWSMLVGLVVCSLLLLLLGGFEVFVTPFKESLRHGLAFVLAPPYAIYYIATRWPQMKKPFRKAISSLLPLIVILILVFFSRPIRNWFLHSPPKKDGSEISVTVPAGPEETIRAVPVADRRARQGMAFAVNHGDIAASA